jgi:hypothetical protein
MDSMPLILKQQQIKETADCDLPITDLERLALLKDEYLHIQKISNRSILVSSRSRRGALAQVSQV